MVYEFGIRLKGSIGDGRDGLEQFVEQAQSLVLNRLAPESSCFLATNELGHMRLLISLNKAVPPLSIDLLPNGQVRLAAKTAFAGPGYHKQVIELIKKLKIETRLVWNSVEACEQTGDDTGYFQHQDTQRLELYYLDWLQTLCREASENFDPEAVPETKWFSNPANLSDVSNASGLRFLYQSESNIIGLTGPRNIEWAVRVLIDPQSGLDFFPCWSDFYADMRFGSAVNKMLFETSWRIPIDRNEVNELLTISALLEDAFRVDPKRNFPWQEWREINDYLIQQGVTVACRELVEKRAGIAGGNPKLGYRRENIRVLSGKWSLELPGHFVFRFLESGSIIESRSVTGPLRTARFVTPKTYCRFGEVTGQKAEELIELFSQSSPGSSESTSRNSDGVCRKVIVNRLLSGRNDFYQVSVFAAIDGSIAVLSILVEGLEQLSWVRKVAQALMPIDRLPTSLNHEMTLENDLEFAPKEFLETQRYLTLSPASINMHNFSTVI